MSGEDTREAPWPTDCEHRVVCCVVCGFELLKDVYVAALRAQVQTLTSRAHRQNETLIMLGGGQWSSLLAALDTNDVPAAKRILWQQAKAALIEAANQLPAYKRRTAVVAAIQAVTPPQE